MTDNPYWKWNPYTGQWEPTPAYYELQQTGDPTLGTNVVYPNGTTQHFDPSTTPVTTFLTGGTNDGITSTNDPAEIAARRADARTRGQQGIAKVAALVAGGAALGGGGLGGGSGLGGYGMGIAPGETSLGSLLPATMRVPALIGAASMSSKGGGSSGTDAANAQADIARRLLEETDPLRKALITGTGMSLLSDGGASPQFAAYRAGAEPQYMQARDNIIASNPAGGGLTAALANLESARAHDLTAARGNIYDSNLSRAMTLATGQTGQALGGLGVAGQIQAANAQANADREAGLYSAIGTGLGAYLGSGSHGSK